VSPTVSAPANIAYLCELALMSMRGGRREKTRTVGSSTVPCPLLLPAYVAASTVLVKKSLN
jgi:hypothetical protein